VGSTKKGCAFGEGIDEKLDALDPGWGREGDRVFEADRETVDDGVRARDFIGESIVAICSFRDKTLIYHSLTCVDSFCLTDSTSEVDHCAVTFAAG
jgi:hypothetical protein